MSEFDPAKGSLQGVIDAFSDIFGFGEGVEYGGVRVKRLPRGARRLKRGDDLMTTALLVKRSADGRRAMPSM